MIWLICFLMLIFNGAAIQDMSGKMFAFPQRSNHFYVKVNVGQQNFSAVTVCHRSFTDSKQSHSFFALSTTDFPSYGFQTCFDSDMKVMVVWVKGVRADYGFLEYVPNKWYSICSTWDSSSGVVQLWMNGQPFTMIYHVEFPITGQSYVFLGQEQSIPFLSTMSFSGMMTDVHMWDRVLSACEIHSYMAEQAFAPGNVVNWAALDFYIKGRIMVHDKQTCDWLATDQLT